MWASIAQGAMQFESGISEGIAARRAAEYNADLLAKQGDIAREEGERTKADIGTAARRAVSSTRAAEAGSGFAVGQGSPLLTVLASLDAAERDVQAVQRRVHLSDWEKELERRAQLFAGRKALIGGITKAGGGALRAGGGAYTMMRYPNSSPSPSNFNPLFGEVR